MAAIELTFAKGWDRHRKRPFGGELSEREARAIHQAGGVKTVIQ